MQQTSALRLFLRCSVKRSTVLRATGVALVITPILIAVNQWERIAAGAFDARFFGKVVMTFCVPYLVSTYSSARAESVQTLKNSGPSAPERK